MESLKHVISMIRPNCSMASVDLKDAYYTVPIHRDHQKYGQLYQFTCLPNNSACAPRLFTLLKPAYSTLRKQGFQSVGYIDDSYLQSITKPECENNVQATTKLFDSLDLYVHPDKSTLEPSQVLEFLGFVLNHDHDCYFISCQGIKYQAGLQRSVDQNTTYHQGSGSCHRQTCGQLP